MDWKSYLRERLNAAPVIASEKTKDTHSERAIILRLLSFADSFLQNKGGDGRVFIMYGLRGIGKSTILFQFYNRLRSGNFFGTPIPEKQVKQDDILYLSIDQILLTQQGETDSPIYNAVKNYCEQVHNRTIEALDKKLIILIDEAQFDKKWAIATKTIFDSSNNIFIVITGSSALALNLDTDTARRSIKEPLFPLSFSEYQIMKNWIFPIAHTANNLKKLILQNDRTSIAQLNSSIKSIKDKMNSKNIVLDDELENYLALGGFPYGLKSTKEIAYRRIVDMINRIIERDMPEVSNYETNSIPDIMKTIGAIALKPAGETSQSKLSTSLNISTAKVNMIIDTLQKTHLIFIVKPFPPPNAVKGLSKTHKYYFMSPTLLSAIKYLNGVNTTSSEQRGILWENAVAASLHKLSFTAGTIYNIMYDPREETNVDFLIQNPLSGEVIPVEVGLNKDERQILSAIDFYRSGHGIIISDFPEISFKDKILKIPFWFLLYL